MLIPDNSSPDFRVPTSGNRALLRGRGRVVVGWRRLVEAVAVTAAIAVPWQKKQHKPAAHRVLLVMLANLARPGAKVVAGLRDLFGMRLKPMLAVAVARVLVAVAAARR
jgi:hypothetical protein